jgi:hypothetical protein
MSEIKPLELFEVLGQGFATIESAEREVKRSKLYPKPIILHFRQVTPESSLELEELKRDKARLEDENKRMRSVFVQIQKLGCLYKGNLTGCAGCIICNEFPEFNEMNKRDRSGLENN